MTATATQALTYAEVAGGLLSAELARVGATVQRSTVGVGRRYGAGAGVIWSSDGLIVTNHHVVGRASKVEIEHEGARYPGEVIARHPSLDLALVEVDSVDLPAIPIGDSDAVRPGQLAIAVGHPLGDRLAVTLGVVVARRPEDALLLTDVTLMPGNSGGPMVDAEGRMIGVNTLIAGERSFSIPVSAVEAFVEQVTGTAPAAYLGVAGTLVQLHQPEELTGIVLTRVAADSPAAAAGLILGDILLAVADAPIVDGETLPAATLRSKPGQPLTLALLRGGEPVTATVTLGGRHRAERGSTECP